VIRLRTLATFKHTQATTFFLKKQISNHQLLITIDHGENQQLASCSLADKTSTGFLAGAISSGVEIRFSPLMVCAVFE
jgi:hypothetical protein